MCAPGRSGALRPLSPLRTVRDSFPSYGSSPCEGRREATRLPASAGSLRDTDREPTHRTRRPEVHQWPRPPSFAFLRDVGSPSFLATKHQVDVCTLAGRANGPYPPRYRAAFASSTFPPHTTMGWPYGSLALVEDQGGGMGFLAFDVSSLLDHVGSPPVTPVARHLRGVTLEHPNLATHRFGPSQSAPLACYSSRRCSGSHVLTI